MTEHSKFVRAAIEVADACRNVEWYGVGCVIVGEAGDIISTGFTGEITEQGKMRHAEDVAIAKALARGVNLSSSGTVLYSTLEPCSVRASGKTPCCQHIVEQRIPTVVYGAKEPYDESLGIVCEGDALLKKAGIEVIYLEALEQECLASVVKHRRK